MSLAAALAAIAPTREGEVLARHTTIGIGGPADVYVMPESTSQIVEVLRLSHDEGVPVFMLGSGSNIVIGDRGMRGVTIESKAQVVSEPKPFRNGEPRFLFRADGGCSFAAVSRQLSSAGFKGLEWACGIPGTLGGACVYNAGAYTGSLADVLRTVTLLDERGDVRELPAAELRMAYRTSALLRGELGACVVLWLELAVRHGDAKALRAQVAAYDRQRLEAQPRGRNSGSTFKNPPGRQAWELVEAVGLRGQLKAAAGDDPAPSFNDFVIKAAALALRDFPRANAAYRDGQFELYSRVNVGVAVAGQDALVVPTVFDADRKSLGQIAKESRALAERVRAGQITPPELSSGTFTVSNLGMYGIESFEAVINSPQAAILAVGAIQERALFRDGAPYPAQLMKVTLSCDHRILYGAEGAELLARVRGLLEEPVSLAL